MATLSIEVRDVRPVQASCDDRHLSVVLADGRLLRAPLWWYPRLASATALQRSTMEFTLLGVHWPLVDEDVSVASILRGEKAPGAREPTGD
jgi:hypothetical protein